MLKFNKTVFRVEGMHCQSCEVLIEKKLLEQKNIKSVDVSLKGDTVEIQYVGDTSPSIEYLNNEFAQYGYKFSEINNTRIDDDSNTYPLFRFTDGRLHINLTKVNVFFKNLFIALLIITALLALDSLHLTKFISVDANSSIFAFFLFGLFAGFSSCAALTGGLLLSMSKNWSNLKITNKSNTFLRFRPHAFFHLGRLVSFAIFGGILGLIGQSISINNQVLAIFTILASILMMVLGLQMLGVKSLQSIRISIPKPILRLIAIKSKFTETNLPFLLGASTFFLPCGFTLVVQFIALTSGSFMRGSLIMFIFALGTLPVLLSISYTGLFFNSKPNLIQNFNFIAGVLVLFISVYTINGQLNILGLTSLNDLLGGTYYSQDSTTYAPIDTDGKQTIKIIASEFEYIPQTSLKIKAGQQAKLIIDNKGATGCANSLAISGLLDSYVVLKKGINKVDLGFPKPGNYKITCSMGMVKPLLITVV